MSDNSPYNEKLSDDFINTPLYRDGISTKGTYLIVASRLNAIVQDGYNCICTGNEKVKFYPNPEYFGIENSDLEDVGIDLGTRVEHHGYVRFYASRRQVAKLLTSVHMKRGTLQIVPAVLAIAPQKQEPKRSPSDPSSNTGDGDFDESWPGGDDDDN